MLGIEDDLINALKLFAVTTLLGQAVVIAAHSQTPDDDTSDAIILACKKTLPNFMVPAMIVWQESLPRNPNGKIDRKRLAGELQDLFQDNGE